MNIVLVTLCAGLLATQAVPGKLHWSSDYGKALDAAKAAKKPLLIVIDNAANPDERFDQTRFAGDQTQIDLLANYQLCRVDGATPYGGLVAKAFRAKQLPFVAITDKTGSVITYRQSGAPTKQDWITALVSRSSQSARSIPATSIFSDSFCFT